MNTGRTVTPKIFGLLPQPCYNETDALNNKIFHLSSHPNYSNGTTLFEKLSGIHDASTIDFKQGYEWKSSNGLILQSGNTTKIYRISIVDVGPSFSVWTDDTESRYCLNFTEITTVDELIKLSHMFCRGVRRQTYIKREINDFDLNQIRNISNERSYSRYKNVYSEC